MSSLDPLSTEARLLSVPKNFRGKAGIHPQNLLIVDKEILRNQAFEAMVRIRDTHKQSQHFIGSCGGLLSAFDISLILMHRDSRIILWAQ